MKIFFSFRAIIGALLLMVLLGEPTVGEKTGLFTPGGLVVFFLLYLGLFHLFDSLIAKYKLVMFQVFLLSFIIYSFFVTGLLNKELTEYIFNPNPFITLIRVQASFFVGLTFYLLNQFFPRKETVSIRGALTFFVAFILIISATGVWGVPSLIFTFQNAFGQVLIFGVLAAIAGLLILLIKSRPTVVKSQLWNNLIFLDLALGLVPSLATFAILVLIMIGQGIYILFNKNLRNLAL